MIYNKKGDVHPPFFVNLIFILGSILFADTHLFFGDYSVSEEYIEIMYESDQDIGGFQFNLEGSSINSYSDGMAETYNFNFTISDDFILAFTMTNNPIPAGTGLLTTIYINQNQDSDLICFSNIVISNSSGQAIPSTFGDCIYIDGYFFLEGGNNLISFRALPFDNSLENMLGEYSHEINYIIGNGIGSFLLDLDDDGIYSWHGNLTEINRQSGYWFAIDPDSNFLYETPVGTITPIDFQYELLWGNNLISYVGNNNMSTLDAIPQNILEVSNFIIGQGVGLFHHDTDNDGLMDTWSGNLNYMNIGKGYWINLEFLPDDSVYTMVWQAESNFSAGSDLNLNMVNENRNLFPFIQSTEQAFYLVKDVVIDSEKVVEGDVILAYNYDVLVGSVSWIGEYTPVPVMGRDISAQTQGFCEIGDIPTFKLFKKDSGEIFDLNGNLNSWSSLGVFYVESLHASSIEIPEKFVLYPAYPNPFNPVTTINFAVPDYEVESQLSIDLFDIKGQKIETLYNGYILPGNQSIQWNGSYQASGLYFIKLTSDEYVATQKIMLIK